MKTARQQRNLAFGAMMTACFAACASKPSQQPVVVTSNEQPIGQTNLVMAAMTESRPSPNAADPGTAVPVTPDDPAWGNPFAPVTMVIWGDYECPFTGKLVRDTLPALQEKYGFDKLRIVWKHNPLPFHQNATPTHLAAETVLRLGGVDAFWSFHAVAFQNQRGLDVASFVQWADESGVNPHEFELAFGQQRYGARVQNDLAFGKKIGVNGTPTSFINGIMVGGVRPPEYFENIIDGELQKARELRDAGVPARRIYAELSDKQYKSPPPKDAPPPPDTTVWQVPIDGSPVRGKKTALVTLVMFGDYQCLFCQRVVPTVNALEKKYGDKLRLVFKQNPLPMHPRAEAAAQFSIEAGVQKGEAAFWAAHQALCDQAGSLDEPDLLVLAVKLGLDPKRIKKAMDGHVHADRIERDQDLADNVQGSGTPHFFINGRRLVGAQPSEKFEALIDEELAKAEKLVADGTPVDKLYDKIAKDGKTAKIERILAPAPTADNPAKGAPRGAPVTIQMFADFQCPFCRRVQESIAEVLARYPTKVRVVWRHKPLPMHAFAQMAAEASVEAFRQKGDKGFWAFGDRLFEAQSSPNGLDRAGIEQIAREMGFDVAKLSDALDTRKHWKAVEADVELAERLKITGTPAFVINDYFVTGAQPFARFKQRIELALGRHVPIAPELLVADAHQPVPLSATAPPPLISNFGSAGSNANPSTNPPVNQGIRYGAKHLLVMYDGARRAPPGITRTRDEAKKRAEEALRRLVAGAKFEDVVTQYSDEPGAANRGGYLGLFPKGAMVAPFETAVENLNVGEISGVVETPFGFHIILRTQ